MLRVVRRHQPRDVDEHRKWNGGAGQSADLHGWTILHHPSPGVVGSRNTSSVNISERFIARPIATSLVMLGIALFPSAICRTSTFRPSASAPPSPAAIPP